MYKALVLGLRDYVNNNNFNGVVLGLSGGVDSALVAAIATDAFGSEKVQAIMLPSPFTGQESLNDAKDAADLLKIKFSNLEISEAMKIVDKTLVKFNGKNFSPGITEENIQSRLRGLLLMALSNRYGFMVLATGNKSEYAVGYSTLYGDMCGGFAPIKDVWKTDVFKLCRWRNENFSDLFKGQKGKVIPENIITKAPTAELKENQKDTDSLPEYEILDEILKDLVEKEISVEKIVSKGFDRKIISEIKKITKLPFKPTKNKFAALAAHDEIVNFSGTLNTTAVCLMKIANDIRFLGSGPRAGYGEIILPANEPGSSIMPGKVNPTQSEAVTMVCVKVIGNHNGITMAGSHGHFELNVFKPLIAHNILQSIDLLADSTRNFSLFCIKGLKADKIKIKEYLDNSLMLVTSLAPYIGYDNAAKIAKTALKNKTTLKSEALKSGLIDEKKYDIIVNPKKMIKPL